jgi:hypothetical protein
VVASSERLHHGADRGTLSLVRDIPAGERLSDYQLREATEHDMRGIEALFEARGIAPGWATWKYLKNPDGIARVCIAEDSHKTIVGMMAHMPRQFTTSDGEPIMALQVVDVYVVPEVRDRGVFLRLLEFGRRTIDGPRFGVPNHNSAIFGLLNNWEVLGPFECWRFPIAIGARLAGSAFAFLTPLVDGLSFLYKTALLPFVPANLEMKRITRFKQDFEIDVKASHGVRSADYLNWRFIDHPQGSRYRAYEFFDNGEPVGYCVLTQIAGNAMLSDFVVSRHNRGCTRLLVDHCWGEGVGLLGIRGTGLALGKLGFMRRPSKNNCTAADLPHGHWIVTPCDIDVDY